MVEQGRRSQRCNSLSLGGGALHGIPGHNPQAKRNICNSVRVIYALSGEGQRSPQHVAYLGASRARRHTPRTWCIRDARCNTLAPMAQPKRLAEPALQRRRGSGRNPPRTWGAERAPWFIRAQHLAHALKRMRNALAPVHRSRSRSSKSSDKNMKRRETGSSGPSKRDGSGWGGAISLVSLGQQSRHASRRILCRSQVGLG